MFNCGRIIFNGFKHADIKGGRYTTYENILRYRQNNYKKLFDKHKNSVYNIWKALIPL